MVKIFEGFRLCHILQSGNLDLEKLILNLLLYCCEDKSYLLPPNGSKARGRGLSYAEKDVKITFSPDVMRFPPNLPNE